MKILTNEKKIEMNIYEWMSATWVPSKEMCGVDLSHIEETHQIPFTRKCLEWSHRTRNKIFCNDGFNMSVQGGFTAYSHPRKPVEIYETMEVGFPSENEPLLENFDGQVAGYTDVMIIQQIIDKHGGIDIYKTLRNCNNKNAQKWKRKLKLERILNEK